MDGKCTKAIDDDGYDESKKRECTALQKRIEFGFQPSPTGEMLLKTWH
jgi:hypothetical protein